MSYMEDLEWKEAQKIVITIDLVSATKKHLKFLKAVDDNGELYHGRVLERAIFRYNYCWLPLLAKSLRSKVSKGPLVVPLDCEWIWHCHRLNPVRYMADCKELFGIIPDPCGKVISSVEGCCKKETQELWNTMYPGEPYELELNHHGFNENEFVVSQYDLVSAVERQTSFYYQVSRSFMKDDSFLEGAVQRYKGFLYLIKRNKEMKSNNFCVPTYDIDLMWHTHQLHPLSYRNDMMCLLGYVLSHDDTDSDRTKDGKLDVGFSRTTKQWNEMFSWRYWRAGTMYMPPLQLQKSCNINPSQPSKIMFIEVMVEVIEVKGMSTENHSNLILSIGKKQNDLLFKENCHLSICSETQGVQSILFQCQPKGVLHLELLDTSLKSFGTCSISLSELDSKLAKPNWIKFESDMSPPITLGMVISSTPSSPIQHMVTRYREKNGNSCSITGMTGNAWTIGGACSGSGGCGGGCGGGGGGGGCRASCGGCRSSCGGSCRGGGNCSAK